MESVAYFLIPLPRSLLSPLYPSPTHSVTMNHRTSLRPLPLPRSSYLRTFHLSPHQPIPPHHTEPQLNHSTHSIPHITTLASIQSPRPYHLPTFQPTLPEAPHSLPSKPVLTQKRHAFPLCPEMRRRAEVLAAKTRSPHLPRRVWKTHSAGYRAGSASSACPLVWASI